MVGRTGFSGFHSQPGLQRRHQLGQGADPLRPTSAQDLQELGTSGISPDLADHWPPSKKARGDRIAALLLGPSLGAPTTEGRKQFSNAGGAGEPTRRLRRGVGPDLPADDPHAALASALGPVLVGFPIGLLILFRRLLLLALVLVFLATFIAHCIVLSKLSDHLPVSPRSPFRLHEFACDAAPRR